MAISKNRAKSLLMLCLFLSATFTIATLAHSDALPPIDLSHNKTFHAFDDVCISRMALVAKFDRSFDDAPINEKVSALKASGNAGPCLLSFPIDTPRTVSELSEKTKKCVNNYLSQNISCGDYLIPDRFDSKSRFRNDQYVIDAPCLVDTSRVNKEGGEIVRAASYANFLSRILLSDYGNCKSAISELQAVQIKAVAVPLSSLIVNNKALYAYFAQENVGTLRATKGAEIDKDSIGFYTKYCLQQEVAKDIIIKTSDTSIWQLDFDAIAAIKLVEGAFENHTCKYQIKKITNKFLIASLSDLVNVALRISRNQK